MRRTYDHDRPQNEWTVEGLADALDEPMSEHRASVIRDYAAGDDEARVAYLNRQTTHLMWPIALTPSECPGADGRFLDGVPDCAWDPCGTTRWTNPSNLGKSLDAELSGNLPRVASGPERN